MGTRWYSRKVFKLTKSYDKRAFVMLSSMICMKVFNPTKRHDSQTNLN